jgi:ABC-type branched-subunit amino acid transport system substrate-binding protein
MKAQIIAGLLAASSAGCAAPDLSGTTFSCSIDQDCTGGKVCGTVGGVSACVAPSQNPIRLGMSGPLQGPSQSLGSEMRRGLLAKFEQVNREGGLFGRKLELDSLNDNYDPALALANTQFLLDVQQTVAEPDTPDIRGPNSVLALIGSIGTPTMLATAPVATRDHVVFFAPFTGAQTYLRDGTNSPYVYNYRAGYYEEVAAMIDYLKDFRVPRVITGDDSYRRLLAFTQHDSYGDAGYSGLSSAYNTRVAPLPEPDASGNPAIARVQYERENVSSVDPAISEAEQFLSGVLGDGLVRQSIAIVMIDTYQPGNKFIRAIKDWLNEDLTRASMLDVVFLHVSFVGSDSLAQALVSAPDSYVDVRDPSGNTSQTYADGVIVTQVVPSYGSQSPGVTAYRQDIKNLDDGSYSFTSLEGHIVASLFVKALGSGGPTLNSESLVKALDTQMTNVDLGIGTLVSFSSTNHQASHTVWGSTIDSQGNFHVPFSWNPTDKIVIEAD